MLTEAWLGLSLCQEYWRLDTHSTVADRTVSIAGTMYDCAYDSGYKRYHKNGAVVRSYVTRHDLHLYMSGN
jgi:hypothetical protein